MIDQQNHSLPKEVEKLPKDRRVGLRPYGDHQVSWNGSPFRARGPSIVVFGWGDREKIIRSVELLLSWSISGLSGFCAHATSSQC
jgi:hypothetical protein